jgi:hypothetical protein
MVTVFLVSGHEIEANVDMSIIMICYSYIIPRDYGFAPNPFYGNCTLATCKPRIRNAASIGDWVIGCGSARNNASGFLVFAMRVDLKLHFNDYWISAQYLCKRPIMNGSLKQMYGDNIYHFDQAQNRWIQEDSHHSDEDGRENENNKERDLQSEHVLISSLFWYFGGAPPEIPRSFRQEGADICCTNRGHKIIRDENLIRRFISWLQTEASPGYNTDPLQFTSFKRYRGERHRA